LKNVNLNIGIIIFFAVVTIIIWQIPGGFYYLYPFTILGTWFHEMAHGLTALILGGEFWYLQIFPDGSGLAQITTNNYLGNLGKAIIAMAGPLGPTFFGSLLIISSKNQKYSKYLLFLLSIIMFLSAILWIRSLIGLIIITLLAISIFYIALKVNTNKIIFITQFIGVQAIIAAFMNVDYLFTKNAMVDGNINISDTGLMEQYLFLPYWLWGSLIILLSVILLFISFHFIKK